MTMTVPVIMVVICHSLMTVTGVLLVAVTVAVTVTVPVFVAFMGVCGAGNVV